MFSVPSHIDQEGALARDYGVRICDSSAACSNCLDFFIILNYCLILNRYF
jgi:hypothetical protein